MSKFIDSVGTIDMSRGVLVVERTVPMKLHPRRHKVVGKYIVPLGSMTKPK